MSSLFLLLPISILFVIGIGVAFWWAIFAGQFDDTEAAALSILQDKDGSDGQGFDAGQAARTHSDANGAYGKRGAKAAAGPEDRPA